MRCAGGTLLASRYPSGMHETEDPELRPRPYLVDEIRAALLLTGAAAARIDDLDVPVDYWRMAALKAALLLDRPVETMSSGGTVYAALRDWPADDEENRKDRRALRASP